jgi:CHAT domain-containing protein
MDAFYASLLGQGSVPEALRDAQVRLIRRARDADESSEDLPPGRRELGYQAPEHPTRHHWAAFQLWGRGGGQFSRTQAQAM